MTVIGEQMLLWSLNHGSLVSETNPDLVD